MRTYLTLDLYPLIEEAEEQINDEGESLNIEPEKQPEPYRSIEVLIDNGCMVIKSRSADPIDDYEIEYPEQMTNEFLIQTELLDIRKWDPMHYSPAYDGGEKCSWELDYNGLKGDEAVRSGKGTYPKGWPLLIDLIDAFNDTGEIQQESVHAAAGYAAELMNADGAVVQMTDMVYLLSVMRMPQDVVAAGIVRAAALEHGYDEETVRKSFVGPVADILDEYGDDWNMSEEDRRMSLIERVKESDSVYFKRLVLAEVMALLVRVKAGIDDGTGFIDSVMTLDEMGLYYAEMISALSDMEQDDRAGVLYSVLVDMYKSVFVSYSLDSIQGAIYQMQGSAAGVVLRRGEYDWHPMDGAAAKDTCRISKSLALFLADRWRKQADEMLVRDGNKTGLSDVPDLRVLKVVMSRSRGNKARKDNKVVLSVLNRMVEEGEQVLAALHAGDKEMRLIERGDIDNVGGISVSFLGLEDDEGNKMAAVFTSMDEIGEIDDEDIKAVPLKTLLRFVKHMDRLDGIIIDPFSDRFLVTKERIAEMLDSLNKDPAGM